MDNMGFSTLFIFLGPIISFLFGFFLGKVYRNQDDRIEIQTQKNVIERIRTHSRSLQHQLDNQHEIMEGIKNFLNPNEKKDESN